MKKLLLFTFITALFLTACGDTKQTISQSGDLSTEVEKSNVEEIVPEENVSLEIVDSGSSIWLDSIGTVWVNSAAVYENTGDTPVEIGESQMNYKAKDGSILGTSTMIYSVPRIVQPGETAIITEATILDGEVATDNYETTTYNFNFDPTDESPNLMEISGVKGIQGEYDYSVTGIVKNPTNEQQEDIRIAAILYDEAGKILGALSGSVDVGLAPNGEAGFELSYPPLPDGIGVKVKEIEVKSYGFTW